MTTRGRKSAASLSVVRADAIEITERAKPPRDLTPEQAEEWRAVVNRMPADWFPRETHGLLAQYCRHLVAARRVAQLIQSAEAGDEFDVDEYDKLLKMQEREGRAISSLATRMRLTQQTTYDKSKKKPSAARKPWDIDAD
jgi:hypothetical protein